MSPLVQEDGDAIGGVELISKGEAHNIKGIWQSVEIHLSQVVEMIK